MSTPSSPKEALEKITPQFSTLPLKTGVDTAPLSQFELIPLKSGIVEADRNPLGSRTPLLLVHGIASTANHQYHWENFLAYAKRNPAFNLKYKIYFYHYDSCRSVPTISRDLQKKLKHMIASLGHRNIKILAYSEGGLLVRNALQDSYVDAHTSEVLAIATPFHGSPLANPDWLRRQVQNDSIFSPVRIALNQAYALTGRRFPAFKEDFRWDNFDGALEEKQGTVEDLSAAQMDRKLLTGGPTVDYALAHKKNFTTYGSYFGLDVDPSILREELGIEIPMPKEHPNIANLFRKNFLFSLIRNNIAHMPLAKAQPDKAVAKIDEISISDKAPASLMMFNDGISPISSSLWLGRYLPKSESQTTTSKILPASKLWNVLRSLRGKDTVRLFAGLDHRNWMDGNTRTGTDELPDLLNPNEKPKCVFEWIIYDLMS